jgi:YD repeat-containing protein
MTKNIHKLLIISMVSIIFFNSCSKDNNSTPAVQTCYLSGVSNVKGNNLQKLLYDANNRLISDTNDSTGTTLTYAYNAQNTMDKITVANKVGTKVYTFVTTFTYDASGKASKAVTTLNGAVYLTNVYTYSGTQLSQITTTYSTNDVERVRFEYTGDNVSKTYLKFDNDPEFLYYEATKFDSNKVLYPEAYKALAMGLIGLLDDYYYLNKNNTLVEKFYDEDGEAFYIANKTFEYNSTSQPTKLTELIDEDGDKSSIVRVYQYNCK